MVNLTRHDWECIDQLTMTNHRRLVLSKAKVDKTGPDKLQNMRSTHSNVEEGRQSSDTRTNIYTLFDYIDSFECSIDKQSFFQTACASNTPSAQQQLISSLSL